LTIIKCKNSEINNNDIRLDTSNPFFDSFNKTITYLKTAHQSPSIKASSEILPNSIFSTKSQVGNQFEHDLAKQISRFNKAKIQKQV